MDEQFFMEQTRRVMSDNTPLPVTINIQEAWLLISGLQLASRHPGISPYMKSALENIGRQFQQAIVERHPQAAELIEFGWNPEMDVPQEHVYVSPAARQRLMDEYGLTVEDFMEGDE